MISGFSNERVSYRTRYLNFPSTMTDSVPTINKPTIHIIKIRFNNIFKNEKVLFAAISIALGIISLLVGMGMYSIYKNLAAQEIFEGENTVATEQLNAISAEDAGITVLNKAGMPAGTTGSQQGGEFMNFGSGGGIDPNSMLLASANSKESASKSKDILTSKKAIVAVDDKLVVNPFLPASEAIAKPTRKVAPKNPYYVLPPAKLEENSDAKLLMNTMVSGIMYDSYSPSAIIKINGVDYFVKKGDIIQGFNIIGINQNTVVIKRGANVFNAKVGRILATLDSNNNTGTYNINQRFGGSGGVDARNLSYTRKK